MRGSLLVIAGFEFQQLLPFYAALVLAGTSVFLFWYKPKIRQAPILFFTGLCTAYFIGTADSFLNIWDEQFHALVAKNLMENPFKPLLYSDPVLDYDFKRWDKNHVWLHKQPLFLWQMMLSIALFGDTVFGVRFPSMVMFACCAVFTYRLGTLFVNRRVGVTAGLFFCFSFFPLQVLAGRYATDHNDIAFLFYVTATLWTWAEYLRSGKKRFLYLLAVFAAGAVLTKWLTGLLIYGVWTASEFVKRPAKPFFRQKLPLILKTFAGTAALVIPWQVYTLIRFPREAKYEMSFNGLHFFEAVEGHGGDALYHIDKMELIYTLGPQSGIILLLGFAVLLVRAGNRSYVAGLSFAAVAVYGFFTLAATKMPCFTLPLFPIGMISLSALIVCPLEFVASKKPALRKFVPATVIIATLYISFKIFKHDEVRRRHTDYEYDYNFNYPAQMKQMELINEVKKQLNSDQPYVLFNTDVRYAGYVSVMFFTSITSYGEMPSQEDLKNVQSQGYIPVICVDSVPDFKRPANVRILEY